MGKRITIAVSVILCLALVFMFMPTGVSASDLVAGYNSTLTYSSSSAAVYSLLTASDYAKKVTTKTSYTDYTPVETAFAFKFQRCGGRSSSYMCELLTGNPTRPYFLSGENTGDHIVTVTFPVWKLNESTGEKTESTASIQVNKVVAEDVVGIMTTIFNDPERFPIKSIGGFRTSDTMRHAYGCAIDINPVENPYNGKGAQAGVVGGHKYLTDRSSPYCIQADGSVVKAFAKYGWWWGGQNWAAGEYNKYIDLMHFSIQANGG